VYKLDSFVGFTGDEQVHAQECYVHTKVTEEPIPDIVETT
jgi:hypothetical protein